MTGLILISKENILGLILVLKSVFIERQAYKAEAVSNPQHVASR